MVKTQKDLKSSSFRCSNTPHKNKKSQCFTLHQVCSHIPHKEQKMFYLAPSCQKLIRVVWVRCKDCPHHEAQHLYGQDFIILDNIRCFCYVCDGWMKTSDTSTRLLFLARHHTWHTRSTPPSMASFLEDMFSMIAPAIVMAHRVNL